MQTEVLDEFLLADDMAKGAPTEEKMQKGVDQVSDSCDSYDLTISIKKTEVVYQQTPGKPYKEPTITVKGQRLQVVDKFTYLGSTLFRVVHIDDEVNARIAKASAAFGRLCSAAFGRLETSPTSYCGSIFYLPYILLVIIKKSITKWNTKRESLNGELRWKSLGPKLNQT